jgi:hypothetical protein
VTSDRLPQVWACAGILACLALVCPQSARGDEVPRGHIATAIGQAVIPPGQEDLLAAMLGRGAELPEACGFAAGQVERSIVRGVYRCPGGEVVIELRHPTVAPMAASRTEKIALVTVRGTPPAALLAALMERVRQREGAFEWLTPKVPQAEAAPGCNASFPLPGILGSYVPDCYPRFAAVLVGLGQTLVIVLGLTYGLIRLYRSPSSSNAE